MRAAWLRRAAAWLHAARAPEVTSIRRVEISCPHGRGLVTVDMTTDQHGTPHLVLRCSAHEHRPPACDQSCLHSADAVRTRATALLVCGPGHGPDDTTD